MLSNEKIDSALYAQCPDFDEWHEGPSIDDFRSVARAIESAATAPLLARIAELTRENAELVKALEEARKDAELLDYIQTNGATVEIIPGAPDFYPVHFRVGGRYRTANESIRAAIRAAIKGQT